MIKRDMKLEQGWLEKKKMGANRIPGVIKLQLIAFIYHLRHQTSLHD